MLEGVLHLNKIWNLFKEEHIMKKIIALLLALGMMLGCACAYATSFEDLQNMLRNNGTATEPPATQAPAQDEGPQGFLLVDSMDGLTVTNYNVVTRDSTNYVYVYLYLEVTNRGDRAVEIDGEFSVMDTSGKLAEEQNYLYAYPPVVAPGEVSYVSEYVMVRKGDAVKGYADIGQVQLKLFRDSYNREPSLPTYVQSAAQVGPGVDKYGNRVDGVFRVAVMNNTGADLVSPDVVVALYDANGQLLYVDHSAVSCFNGLSIPNGNGFVVDGNMNVNVAEILKADGWVVDNIKSIVYMK